MGTAKPQRRMHYAQRVDQKGAEHGMQKMKPVPRTWRYARGEYMGRGRGSPFRLLRGSFVAAETTSSFELKERAVGVRGRAIREGVMVAAGRYYELVDDIECGSATEAATIVAGTPVSGHIAFGYPPGMKW